MMDSEKERLEDGLRRISPAPAPQELIQRLRAAVETQPADCAAPRRPFHWLDWLRGWHSLTVAGPAAAVILIGWLALRPPVRPAPAKPSETPSMDANAVQVGHSLLAAFDTVAQLPGGEPVRFRCREWQDEVVIHDNAHGVVISQSTPRVEVVPVRFETY